MKFEDLELLNIETSTAEHINISVLNMVDNICSYKSSKAKAFLNQHKQCTIQEMIDKITNNDVYVVNLNIFKSYFNK